MIVRTYIPPLCYTETKTDRNLDTLKTTELYNYNKITEQLLRNETSSNETYKKRNKKKTKQLSHGGAPLQHDMKLLPALNDF